MSASSVSGQAAREPPAAAHPNTPPWEKRQVSQVPFMRTNSSPVSEGERAALPSFWPSQAIAPQQPRRGEHIRAGKSTNYGPSPVSPANNGTKWPRNQSISHAPISAGFPHVPQQMPYESVRIPNAPKTAPILRSFVHAPPSPPQSLNLSRSSSASQKSGISPPLTIASAPPALPALPGTMSTRDRAQSRSRGYSGRSNDSSQATTSSQETRPLGQRVKTGFRNMFKRDPIDESQFERIGDRHWTDD